MNKHQKNWYKGVFAFGIFFGVYFAVSGPSGIEAFDKIVGTTISVASVVGLFMMMGDY